MSWPDSNNSSSSWSTALYLGHSSSPSSSLNSSRSWSTALCHGHSSSPSSSLSSRSRSSNSSATTVMADGSGRASTAVLVYLHLVVTGVTMVDNSGTSVVTALARALVVAIAAVVTATTVIVGSILEVATMATPLLPVVVVHRRIG